MEFFERAHVVLKKPEADGDMKRQIKQMLYGYKQNDNEVIRNAAKIENDVDDSSSVSGFSDLNLTASSSEGHSTRQRISIIDPNLSFNGTFETQSPKSNLEISFDDNDDDSMSKSIDSLSDLKDDIESLSEASLDVEQSDNSGRSDDDFSITSTSIDSSTDMEASDHEPFDHDGKLASKILDKLKLNDKNKKNKKDRNRKVEVTIDTFSMDSSIMESDDLNDDMHTESETDRYSESSINYTQVLSPSFVSIKADGMTNQSLSEVLGDYKHPIIRNLPSEAQNVFATNKSGIFSTSNLDNSKINEASDSLLPEIGSRDDSDLTDLDASTVMAVDESTTCYDDTLQSDQTFQRETSIESIDTRFVNPVQVFYGKNCCILVLKHPAEIYIHGKVQVKLFAGSVEIGGYTLQDKRYDVYAPNYNCSQYLRTIEHDKGYYGLFGKLTGSGLSVAAAEEIVTTLCEHDSVIQMQELNNRVMQFVENNCTVTDLFTKTNKNVDGCFKKASQFLGCSLYLMKPWKSFVENPSWKQVLKYGYKQQSRGIVCGGKNSGKSFFLRYYVNKLLASGPVLFIDLDPGQSEFTVAGNVSASVVTEPLLGPSFTHLKSPERMLNIGLINTMDNTRRYAAAVKEIIAYCHSEERFQRLPWVVNTMGMCNALGLQFMALITMLIKPTFMLQLDSKNPKKRFELYLSSDTIKDLYTKYQRNCLFSSINPPDDLDYDFVLTKSEGVKNSFSLTPKDERYLNFLAYFGSLQNNSGACGSDFLLSIVPYEVDLRNLYIGVNVRVNSESIARVINGKVVALCKHRGDTNGRVFTLADEPLQCFGHGLVRGVDAGRGLCYVVTPAAGAALAAADTLLYADWAPELPAAPAGGGPGPGGPAPGGPAVPTPAPYRAPAALAPQLLTAPRRRYNPLQLLKMSRSPKVKPSS